MAVGTRVGRTLGGIAIALLAVVAPLRGQAGVQATAPLSLEVTPGGTVDARLAGVLAGRGMRGSLESGLPVRLLLVAELWRDRFLFDAHEGRHEWRATVRYDPLAESYRIETGDGAVLQAESLEEADRRLAGAVRVPLSPGPPGRYYYLARLEIETLALSDLEELRRWLQGDLGPTMDRDAEVGSSVGRGLGRMLMRAFGLPIQRFEARSRAFDGGGPGGD